MSSNQKGRLIITSHHWWDREMEQNSVLIHLKLMMLDHTHTHTQRPNNKAMHVFLFHCSCNGQHVGQGLALLLPRLNPGQLGHFWVEFSLCLDGFSPGTALQLPPIEIGYQV